jgi:hypothetical protein
VTESPLDPDKAAGGSKVTAKFVNAPSPTELGDAATALTPEGAPIV